MGDMPVYLDNNATTPLRKSAINGMLDAMGPPANPSSVHSFGRSARSLVESAREAVATLAGCSPENVVFTSGGTESNNLVLAQYDNVITSAIEHDSVRHVHDRCQLIAVDENGIIDLDQLAAKLSLIDDALKPNTIISVMAANNKTGVLQPIAQIAEMARSSNIAFHSDMVQAFGKNHLDFIRLLPSFINVGCLSKTNQHSFSA